MQKPPRVEEQDQTYAYYGYQEWKIKFLLQGEKDDSMRLNTCLEDLCGVLVYAPAKFNLFKMTYFPKCARWWGDNDA